MFALLGGTLLSSYQACLAIYSCYQSNNNPLECLMIIHNLRCCLKDIMHSNYVHRLFSANDNESLPKSLDFFNITSFKASSVLHVQCTWKCKSAHEFSLISIATWCRATTMIGWVLLYSLFPLLGVWCSWTLTWKKQGNIPFCEHHSISIWDTTCGFGHFHQDTKENFE